MKTSEKREIMRNGQKTQRRILSILLAVVILALVGVDCGSSFAADKVVVIPLFKSGKSMKNVIRVAKSGGDFTDPVAAVNSITDASDTNPYLVVVAPGIYEVYATVKIPAYTHLTGSGPEQTIIRGHVSGSAFDENSAIIAMSDGTSVSHLQVVNNGGGGNSFGIGAFNTTKGVKIDNVSVVAQGGTTRNYGFIAVKVEYLGRNFITHSNFLGDGGSYATGAYFNHSSVIISTSKVQSYGRPGGSTDFAILAKEISLVELHNVKAQAFGAGTLMAGVRLETSSSLYADSLAAGSQFDYGVFISNDSKAAIRNSVIIGNTAGIRMSGTTDDRIINSEIRGGIDNNHSGTTECHGLYDQNLNGVGC